MFEITKWIPVPLILLFVSHICASTSLGDPLLNGLTLEKVPLIRGHVQTALAKSVYVPLEDGAVVLYLLEPDVTPPRWYVVLLRDPKSGDFRRSLRVISVGDKSDNRPAPTISTNTRDLIAAGFPPNTLALLVHGRTLRLITSQDVINGVITPRGSLRFRCRSCNSALSLFPSGCATCAKCLARDPAESRRRNSNTATSGRPWAASAQDPLPGELD